MHGKSSLASCTGASRFRLTSSLALEPDSSPMGPAHPAPALHTRTSTRPSAASAFSTSSSGPPGSARSAVSGIALVWAAISRSRSSFRPVTISRAPEAASRIAVAAPMPEEAPVTRTTASTNRIRPHLTSSVTSSCGGEASPQPPITSYALLLCPDRDPRTRPAADDVAHGQQAGHILSVDDDEVPEVPGRHGRCRLLERPVGRGEDDVCCAVVGHDFGVRILAGAQGVKDVPFSQYANGRMTGVHDNCGAHSLAGHQPGRLAQRMSWSDAEDDRGHPVSYLHEAGLLSRHRRGPSEACLCACDFQCCPSIRPYGSKEQA